MIMGIDEKIYRLDWIKNYALTLIQYGWESADAIIEAIRAYNEIMKD